LRFVKWKKTDTAAMMNSDTLSSFPSSLVASTHFRHLNAKVMKIRPIGRLHIIIIKGEMPIRFGSKIQLQKLL
jgi:hypothetical protein